MFRSLTFAVVLLASTAAHGQETRSASPDQPAPPAKIEDLAWLSGEWEGGGPGETRARAVFSGPTGDHLTGHFVQASADGVSFLELMDVVETNGTLVFRLRHFNADLTGWEEKDVVRSFPLVSVSGDAWFFDDLTFRKDGPDGMVAAVRARMADGGTRELVFRYRRIR